MGYTHYWYKKEELPKDKWDQFTTALSNLFLAADDICLEYDTPEKAVQFDGDAVRFNGKGDEGHETFIFTRLVGDDEINRLTKDEHGRYFSFCKTAEKPYDWYVIRVLKIAEDVFGDDVNIQSDGDWDKIRKEVPDIDNIFSKSITKRQRELESPIGPRGETARPMKMVRIKVDKGTITSIFADAGDIDVCIYDMDGDDYKRFLKLEKAWQKDTRAMKEIY